MATFDALFYITLDGRNELVVWEGTVLKNESKVVFIA
jgi:hypothetical protein